MRLQDLLRTTDELLCPEKYSDYAPNGLQVEGTHNVRRIVTGVTASLELIERAREMMADAVLVHHGWFWKHDNPRITGIRKERMAALLAGNMSLIAYHLPLDDHPDIGNNTLIGKRLGIEHYGKFGQECLGCIGSLSNPVDPSSLRATLKELFNREPLLVGEPKEQIHRIAWCSGAAQDMIEEARIAGADAFISGEISERTTHLAKELGIAYYACGHHATERFGIQALGEWIAARTDIEVTFIDIDNPV